MPNTQVSISGLAVPVAGTGQTAPAAGAWQVYDSTNTLYDQGATSGAEGAGNRMAVGAPAANGGQVTVQAFPGAAVGANYTFRSQSGGFTSSGVFDIVAAAPAVPTPAPVSATVVSGGIMVSGD